MSEVCHLTADDIGPLTPLQLYGAWEYAHPKE